MNMEGKWSLTTPLMGLGLACSYYKIFRQSLQLFLDKNITWRSILKTDHLIHLNLKSFWLQLFFDPLWVPRDQFEHTRDLRTSFFDPKTVPITFF